MTHSWCKNDSTSPPTFVLRSSAHMDVEEIELLRKEKAAHDALLPEKKKSLQLDIAVSFLHRSTRACTALHLASARSIVATTLFLFPLHVSVIHSQLCALRHHTQDFPASVQAQLREIDDDGSGILDEKELTEMAKMYSDMKKASAEGCIAISTLPKEIQSTLEVFDVDGDGSVAPIELARAAE